MVLTPHRVGIIYIVLAASGVAQSTRKSLRFGSRHPSVRYVTEPQVTPSFATDANPFDVARAFIASYTNSDHYIRDDSYTDSTTGITHVYVRQLYHGLEVADGDININIRDGQVLSFGDSFFQGSTLPFVIHSLTTHGTYCAYFADRNLLPAVSQPQAQNVLFRAASALEEWYTLHCDRPLAAVKRAATTKLPNDFHDPRHAALYFMIAAHPDTSVVEELAHNFDDTIAHMTVTHEPLHVAHGARHSALISGLPGTLSPVKARLAYVQVPTRSNLTALHATWRLEVEMAHNWYEAYISVHEPSTPITVIDWASDSSGHHEGGHLNVLEAKLAARQPVQFPDVAAYKVWKWGINDPESGERTFEPALRDLLASPKGWHTVSRVNNPKGSPDWVGKDLKDHDTEYLQFNSTWGNNVFAQENWEGADQWISNHRPNGHQNLTFAFDDGVEHGYFNMDPKRYINLTITQLFYTSNMVHDLYYRYGFNELAGNFQQDNYQRGGRDKDAVIASAQDGSSLNNAYFMAPPDGQNGRCRMFLWDMADPLRDGSFDAGIVIHELSHGLSSRLTGGPRNAGCLAWGESAGMGEGWGDFLATTIRSNADRGDYPIGSWTSNQPEGVRRFPYSTNLTVNPSTYHTLDDPESWGLHSFGEVWAEILWIVSQKLVQKHGHSPTLFPPTHTDEGTSTVSDFYSTSSSGGIPVPKHGNTLMLQLVILGMKLQPCRPSFFAARDAIIHADHLLTGGENFCDLWSAFGSRGLGEDAVFLSDGSPWDGGEHIDGHAVPERCN